MKGMDLPWHGGAIQKGSDRLLLVSYYNDPRPTPEQLKAWWPEALAAEWMETSREPPLPPTVRWTPS